MFRQFIDKIRSYYRAVVLPNDIFQENEALTIEEKKLFVSLILSKTEARRLIEKYIRWKVGIKTRAAMRSVDDRETLKMKEQAYALGEQTIDFQNFWNEAQRSNDTEEAITKEQESEKIRFKLFGQ